MGSAILYFSLYPEKALLSDINSELVQTFIAVRDHPRAVYNRITKLPVGRDAYYKIRNTDPTSLHTPDQAARFIYLNRFCFNGIYRTNLSGNFNVPYAASKTGKIQDWPTFLRISKNLQNADIQCSDFEQILKTQITKGDFVYLDPPYAVANRRIFRQYGPQTFGLSDINRLNESLHHITKKGADFLVSYAVCTEALNAFSEWNIKRVSTQRNVAGFTRHRRKAVEILVSNME